jgi:hypothetical protein
LLFNGSTTSVKEIFVLNVSGSDPLHDQPEVRQTILQLTRSIIYGR